MLKEILTNIGKKSLVNWLADHYQELEFGLSLVQSEIQKKIRF